MNQELTNHSSALDIDEIWAAIEPQVDQINARRKKRKSAFFSWLSGLSLLVAVGIAGFFLTSNRFQTDEIINQSLPEPVAATSVIIADDLPLPEKEAASLALATSPEINPEVTAPLSAKTGKDGFPNLKNDVPVTGKVVVENSPLSISNTSVKTEKPNVIVSEIIPKNIRSNNTVATTTIPVRNTKSAEVISVKNEKRSTVLPLANSDIGLTVPDADVPILNFNIKNNKSLVPPPIYIERPTFSLEFQAGISAVNRTLNATEASGNRLDTLVNLRNSLEEPLEALHANLLVNAHFPSGFFVSSGVAFTQINEVYRNNSTVTEPIVDSMGIQKLIINLSGDTIPVIGPVISTRTTTFTKRFYNAYRLIDIPLFVGYQYDFGDWKTDFSLGFIANILLATEGRVPNTPTTDLDLNTNGDDLYRSRVDYSLQFGIGVTKTLSDKLSLRVNPNFRYYSRNFMKEGTGLNQRYLLFGATVGLRMDL